MVQLSTERIQEMKDLLEKKEGREFSWAEASEAAHNLAGLAELLLEIHIKEKQREKRLIESPDGFLLEDGYSCSICGYGSTSGGGIWYDKWGMKCMICQGAIKRKEIPASLGKNKESWYSKYDIESRFNIKGPALRSWIKQGILKARTITRDGKGSHMEVFLIKDNKDTLPPKKMVESQSVKTEKDGQTWFHSEPWYRFVNPHEHLKGYKIMDHLRVVPPEEVARREAEEKKKWEEKVARRQKKRDTHKNA